MRAFIIPVADEQPLAVLRFVASRPGYHGAQGVSSSRTGIVSASLPLGSLAREQRGARAADGPPAEIEMQHRADEHPHVISTGLPHCSTTPTSWIDRDLAQKVELVFAQAHMLAVVSFRFAASSTE